MSERVWDFSCKDWEKRIMAGRSLMPDLPLFEEEAADALAIFDNLRLPDVEGTPLLADAVGDWFREIVAAVLGSRDPATNRRHVAEVLAMISKGNSKTTYSAELMLTALIMNRRPRARFFLIAPSQATADVAFDTIKGAIQLDPELVNKFWIRDQHQLIEDRVTKAELAIKTFSLEILNGPKPVGVLLDEIHLLAKDKNAAKIMRQIRGGLQKNRESFFIMTTTQSNEEPEGIFLQELTAARDIRDGKRKGRVLPILYEFPMAIATDEQKWSNPDLWHLVMPNLGRSLDIQTLLDDWNEEKEKGDEARRLWASQHLNIQIGLGMKGDGWVGGHFWPKHADQRLFGREGLKYLLRNCDVAVVGVDGGGLDDLLGLCVIGRERGTRRWLIWNMAWCHEIVLDRRQDIAVKLADLQRLGVLKIVEDQSNEDIEDLCDIIEEVRDAGLLPEKKAIGCDPVGVTDIVDELVLRGFTVGAEDDPNDIGEIEAVKQGFYLNSAIDTLGRRVAQGKVLHEGSPLMTWCVGNAKAEKRGNAKMITKQASGSAKIDPLIATFVAAHLMARNPEAKKRSVYETREMRILG